MLYDTDTGYDGQPQELMNRKFTVKKYKTLQCTIKRNKHNIKKNKNKWQTAIGAPELVTLAVALHMCYEASTLSLTQMTVVWGKDQP